jgi:ankyrin repeat protein
LRFTRPIQSQPLYKTRDYDLIRSQVIEMDPLSDSLLVDLVSATKRGDVEHIRRLLALGASPHVIEPESGWSALHTSVLYNPLLLPTLLEYTADPDAPWVMGGTPLSYVVHELAEDPDDKRKQELFEAIAVLVQAGANPECGGADQTALELARLYGRRDIEDALLAPRER